MIQVSYYKSNDSAWNEVQQNQVSISRYHWTLHQIYLFLNEKLYVKISKYFDIFYYNKLDENFCNYWCHWTIKDVFCQLFFNSFSAIFKLILLYGGHYENLNSWMIPNVLISNNGDVGGRLLFINLLCRLMASLKILLCSRDLVGV